MSCRLAGECGGAATLERVAFDLNRQTVQIKRVNPLQIKQLEQVQAKPGAVRTGNRGDGISGSVAVGALPSRFKRPNGRLSIQLETGE